ncbi:hypothetical protein [Hyphomicrobium sp.]|uniref:hypothetical protein n=1 Tax=Hyphomicrobium sp. TaxID=82 RepID=UPI001D36919C|nr:hypothetical protein [Hyphomicrobium sp.]MBY0561436.1 hypothetical protein [Hyphomicrobium sp.]
MSKGENLADMMFKTFDAAFPSQFRDEDSEIIYAGVSVADFFAAHALAPIIAMVPAHWSAAAIAERAYEIGLAMASKRKELGDAAIEAAKQEAA